VIQALEKTAKNERISKNNNFSGSRSSGRVKFFWIVLLQKGEGHERE
jgi:hypothetical protein